MALRCPRGGRQWGVRSGPVSTPTCIKIKYARQATCAIRECTTEATHQPSYTTTDLMEGHRIDADLYTVKLCV